MSLLSQITFHFVFVNSLTGKIILKMELFILIFEIAGSLERVQVLIFQKYNFHLFLFHMEGN